ncbi:MAG: cell division FtsA domain-containing protein [Firmicutes bacterium]|nr:cell division FtsA domain-containing protein [Bacillota bacterium]
MRKAQLYFEGMEVVLKVGGNKYTTDFSGISGTDFVVPNEVYKVVRSTLDEASFHEKYFPKALEILVPSNFIRIVNGLIDCDDNFVILVGNALDGFPIKDIKFLSHIQQKSLNIDGVLIDVGLLDTSVAGVYGGRVDFIQTVPIGFSHLVNDLMVVKKIEAGLASAILSQAVVTLDETQDSYQFEFLERTQSFSVQMVNDILKSRIEELAEEIVHLVSPGIPLYITGEDFLRVHGAKNYFAQILGFNIKELPL